MESSQNDSEFKAIPHDPFEDMENLADSDLTSTDPWVQSETSSRTDAPTDQEGSHQEDTPIARTPADPDLRESILEAALQWDEPIPPMDPGADGGGIIIQSTDEAATADREPEPDWVSKVEAPALLEDLIESIDQEFEDLPVYEQDLLSEQVEPSFTEQQQFVVFSLSGTEYAVPILNVTEIGYPPDVTPLPNVPEWVLGVANLRGDLISMIDLRTFFGLERATLGGSTRMLVGRTTKEDINVGLIVDGAQGIRHLPVDLIDRPTAEIESQIAPYLYGAYEEGEHLLVLLDLDRVLNSPKLRQFSPR